MILQNERGKTISFVKKGKIFTKYFTFEQDKYHIQTAYGNFIVAKSIKDRNLKLLELGGPNDSQVVTEMRLNQDSQMNLQFDSWVKRPNFAILFEPESTKFHFYRQPAHKILHFAPPSTLQ